MENSLKVVLILRLCYNQFSKKRYDKEVYGWNIKAKKNF